MEPKELLHYFREKQPQMVADLKELVKLESPSTNKMLLDQFVNQFRQRLQRVTNDIRIITNEKRGDILSAEVRTGDHQSKPALILCHYDTVWSEGTLSRMPLTSLNGKLFGPGTLDMKGGIIIVEYALRAINDLNLTLPRPVIWVLNGDEEIGSTTSRQLIEHYARKAEYVLVMEPPLPNGYLKTARKGTGRFELLIKGIEAHSGINPEDGVNANVELAHQILAITRLADPEKGTTINVGVVSGGSRPNVVAGQAMAQIDVRVWYQSEAERVETGLRSLRPVLSGAELSLSGSFTRPPMERNGPIERLFQKACKIAGGLDLHLKEGETGGASDGNFAASLGIPTLDGLGPVGEGAHSPNEHIEVASLFERAALLTALLLEL